MPSLWLQGRGGALPRQRPNPDPVWPAGWEDQGLVSPSESNGQRKWAWVVVGECLGGLRRVYGKGWVCDTSSVWAGSPTLWFWADRAAILIWGSLGSSAPSARSHCFLHSGVQLGSGWLGSSLQPLNPAPFRTQGRTPLISKDVGNRPCSVCRDVAPKLHHVVPVSLTERVTWPHTFLSCLPTHLSLTRLAALVWSSLGTPSQGPNAWPP